MGKMLKRLPSSARKEYHRRGLAAIRAEIARRKKNEIEPTTVVEFARLLGTTRQAWYGWSKVPVDRCLDIERMLGIPRHVLRGDVYRQDPPNLPVRKLAKKPTKKSSSRVTRKVLKGHKKRCPRS